MVDVTFQSAQEDDFEALLTIRIEAMRESLTKIGRFSPERARQRLRATFQAEATRFILWGGEWVGFYMLVREKDSLKLEHFYILPRFQRSGIGGQVLSGIIAESETLGLPIKLGALKASPANDFYQRHGFALVEEQEWDNLYIRFPKNFDSPG